MTPEQKREQWLKRVLPALVVLVLYFTVASNFITSKSKKAEDAYKLMRSKGIDASSLPGKQQDIARLSAEIMELEKEEQKVRASLGEHSSFLAQKGSKNETLDKLALIMASNHLQILEEKSDNEIDKNNLSKSFLDSQLSLQAFLPSTAIPAPPPAAPATNAVVVPDKKPDVSKINIWSIHYVGSYIDNYLALTALLESDVKVLPISLSMKTVESSEPPGQLDWTLSLWLK
jgi:hypothetical protein